MVKNLLAVVFAAVSLCGTASARDVDFNNGSLPDLISVSQAQADEMSSPETITSPETGRVIHSKGFVKKDLPNAAWKSFKNVKANIPNALDLRPKLTQVENQGSCGSCWAFSLTATHRDGHALNGKDPGRLSQEWLIEHSTYAAGCQGGYFDSANDFIVPKGQPLYSACPYSNGSGKCSATLPVAASIKAWFMLGEQNQAPTVRDIEAYMALSGKPVSIAVAAAAGSWESYSGGVYNKCAKGELDHMINIVGWDNEGAQFDANGNLPAGKGIWILRNSWGKSWGEQGYMRTKMTNAAGERCNNVAGEGAFLEY